MDIIKLNVCICYINFVNIKIYMESETMEMNYVIQENYKERRGEKTMNQRVYQVLKLTEKWNW